MTRLLDTPGARMRALALLALTQLLVVLDASIITVAIPSIGAAFDVGGDQLSWVVNAYVLALGGCLLLGGRLADLLGRRRIFGTGIALFTAASLAGALAPTVLFLDASRALQGLGAALASPAALSIITTAFTAGPERNRALSVWGAVAGAGGAIGVLAGGLLTELLGWRWVLLVNVPLGAAVLLLTPFVLPAFAPDRDRHRLDLPGAATLTLGLVTLVYMLTQAPSSGWLSVATAVRAVVALVLLVAFVVIELRSPAPLIPFSIFRLANVRTANLVGLLTGMALISMFFLTTLYLQNVLQFSALQAGLAFLPLSVAMILAASAAAPGVARFGVRPVLLVALLCVVAGLVWLSLIGPSSTYTVSVLGPTILAGVGLGGSIVPTTLAAIEDTGPDQAGLASGLVNAGQQLGGAVGLALTSTVGAVLIGAAPATAATLTRSYAAGFVMCAGFALVGLTLAAALLKPSRRPEEDDAEKDEAEEEDAQGRGGGAVRPVPTSG